MHSLTQQAKGLPVRASSLPHSPVLKARGECGSTSGRVSVSTDPQPVRAGSGAALRPAVTGGRRQHALETRSAQKGRGSHGLPRTGFRAARSRSEVPAAAGAGFDDFGSFAHLSVSCYASSMNTKLAEAFKAAQSLPEEAQDAIALEVLQEVEHYMSEESDLTPEQIAIVEDRLSRPFEYASDEEVSRVLGKHNIHVRQVA